MLSERPGSLRTTEPLRQPALRKPALCRNQAVRTEAANGLGVTSEAYERVAQGIGGSLTLIIGPAGAGKTTLLTEWAAGRADSQMPVWLSPDTGDNDSYRF